MSLSKKFLRNVRPLIILNSIVNTGLMEYFVDNKIEMIGMIYSTISIIFYCLMDYFIFPPVKSFQQNVSLILKISYKSSHFYFMLIYIVINICGILRKKNVRRFMLQIETCNLAMNQLNILTNTSKLYRHQYYLILLVFSIIIIMIIIDCPFLFLLTINYWKLLFIIYLHSYPYIGILVTDITFIFWIRYITMQLHELNILLKNMLTTTIDSPQHKRVLRIWNNTNNDSSLSNINRRYQSDAIKIIKVREIHLELIKCARNINDAYGLHILIIITTDFVLITIVSYNMYCILTNEYNSMKIYFLFSFLYLIFHFGLEIFIINNACAQTKMEILDFMLQVNQNALSFTSCGFFDLDYRLINNVANIVITYLVILIQIGQLQPVFPNNSTVLNDF